MQKRKTTLSRREFVAGAGAVAAAFAVVPCHVLGAGRGRSPSEKLNIACIGVGGRGRDDLNAVGGENIVALCDVDARRAGDAFQKFPKAKPYRDFRKMFDQMTRSIDAIVLGDKGSIMYGSHGAGGLRIFPEEKMRAYKQPAKTIPRVRGHHQDWLDSIRNHKPAGSDFALYGGPLTEIALLGVIAFRMLGQELKWDARRMQFTNCLPRRQRLHQPALPQGLDAVRRRQK